MSTINDGGHAFPHIDSRCGRFDAGMSLRDYFATHASEEDIKTQLKLFFHARAQGKDFGVQSSDWRAYARYMHADAMIKAREAAK